MTIPVCEHQSCDEFLNVQETAKLLKTTPKTLYTYLSNTGKYNGKPRKRLPQRIYRKIGRKVIFLRDEVLSWVREGAQLVDNNETIREV